MFNAIDLEGNNRSWFFENSDEQEANFAFIRQKGHYILVDAPLGAKEALTSIGIDVPIQKKINIQKIILTHTHEDHISGLRELLETLGSIDIFPELFVGKGYELPFNYKGRKVIVSNELEVGMQKSSGILVPVPGHSQDSLALYYRSALYCGDVLYHSGFGRTDLYGSDIGLMAKSLKRLFDIYLEDKGLIAIPGHGKRFKPISEYFISGIFYHSNESYQHTMETIFGKDSSAAMERLSKHHQALWQDAEIEIFEPIDQSLWRYGLVVWDSERYKISEIGNQLIERKN